MTPEELKVINAATDWHVNGFGSGLIDLKKAINEMMAANSHSPGETREMYVVKLSDLPGEIKTIPGGVVPSSFDKLSNVEEHALLCDFFPEEDDLADLSYEWVEKPQVTKFTVPCDVARKLADENKTINKVILDMNMMEQTAVDRVKIGGLDNFNMRTQAALSQYVPPELPAHLKPNEYYRMYPNGPNTFTLREVFPAWLLSIPAWLAMLGIILGVLFL